MTVSWGMGICPRSGRLISLPPERLAELYPDFAAYAPECRFAGCRHAGEPDCRVKAAVAAGELDAGRYQRYLTLLDELAAAQEY